MSPDVGFLDEEALERAVADDPDAAMALVADLVGATDVALRELARRLAGRLLIDLARAGKAEARGVGRLRRTRADQSAGDLDLDASLEAVVAGRAAGRAPDLRDLVATEWARPSTALCLLVDRSGSMGGERLATAAVAAAACAWRAPDDYSVLAFSDKVIVVKGQDEIRPAEAVVDDLLTLRGFGPTDVALALRAAGVQLASSRAARRVVVLLSDCRPTAGREPALDAGALDELAIVAPAGDREDADLLAAAVGARVAPLGGPSDVPAVFETILER